MSEPDVRWAPIAPKPKSRRRLWLLIGLAIAVLVIGAALLFVLLPRDGVPAPDASGSPSPSTSASPSASDSASPEPTESDEPPAPPVETAPPAVDPSLEGFRAQVGVWLDDAPFGLDIIASSSGADALPVVTTLQEDAQRLSDAQAPSSIYTQWREGIAAYTQTLTELHAAVSTGSGVAATVEASRGAVQNLRALVGL